MSIKEYNQFFLEQAGKSENIKMTIHIKRKRHFAGSLIPYYCVFGMGREAFMAYCDKVYNDCQGYEEDEDNDESVPTVFELLKTLVEDGRIKRVIRIFFGKTMTLELSDDECHFFAFVDSKPEFAFSNQINIQSGNDCAFEIETKYHWKTGMSLSLERK